MAVRKPAKNVVPKSDPSPPSRHPALNPLTYQREAEPHAADEVTCGTWEEAQPYLQCNVHLREGFRINRSRKGFELTALQCLSSIVHINNETGNIWSHLVAFLVVLYSTGVTWMGGPWEGREWFLVYLLGCQICFLMSTLYHTFNCHSFHTWAFLLQLDYLGIGCAFMGSSYLNLFPLFYCFPDVMIAYQVTFALVGICVIVALLSPLNAEELGTAALVFRGIMVVTMAVIASSPILHHRILTGSFWFVEKFSIWWKFSLLGAIIVLTGIVYAKQWPEHLHPEKYNYWFHSHQLMHLSVAFCGWLLFRINLDYYDFRMGDPSCRVP